MSVMLPLMPWRDLERIWPAEGRQILACHDESGVVVYQAYRPEIAEYAVAHQRFGGPFQLTRMSWIKPGFLWMMHRSGWARKPGQERVLAVRLPHAAFVEVLDAAVPSSFDRRAYPDRETWRAAVAASEVRVQWDPDHDPTGRPLARRAVQLGLRGETLRRYAWEWPVEILNITALVAEQRTHVTTGRLDLLHVPAETIYPHRDVGPGAGR